MTRILSLLAAIGFAAIASAADTTTDPSSSSASSSVSSSASTSSSSTSQPLTSSTSSSPSVLAITGTVKETFTPITKSLWIPYQSIDGVPLASIAGNDSTATTYVLHCPTESPSCALSPNLTYTGGPSTAIYARVTGSQTASVGCTLAGSTSAVCTQYLKNAGNIHIATSTLASSQITFRAVEVTATANSTSTSAPGGSTGTSHSSSASSHSTSSATLPSTGAAMATSAPLAFGGIFGAGLAVLAVL